MTGDIKLPDFSAAPAATDSMGFFIFLGLATPTLL